MWCPWYNSKRNLIFVSWTLKYSNNLSLYLDDPGMTTKIFGEAIYSNVKTHKFSIYLFFITIYTPKVLINDQKST